MQFSMAWLRELCATDATVEDVAKHLTARGLTVDSIEERGRDHILDVDIPANRPDCLGHRGIARELVAAIGGNVTPLSPMPDGEGEPSADTVTVDIQAPEVCHRFTARVVRGVRVGPSPPEVVARLEACGLRSINNVVDASNLVMLDTGNPIHFFDLHKLKDACIQVRQARDGDALTTLDDIERALTPDTLLIADPGQPLALAGIMGGADSEIDDDSTDVLIEAAYFAPPSIRATARRLGMHTDASHRFERGVDPEGVIAAQTLAAQLLMELAGGTPAVGLIDQYPGRSEPATLTLRLAQVERLLGYRPEAEESRAALQALGLNPRPIDDNTLEITVPSWRVDLECEADLVEEVARHLGYDRIPTVVTAMTASVTSPSAPTMETRARDALAEAGFHEASGYAMLAAGEDDPFLGPDAPEPLRLANPITETMDVMRRSLLPGLIKATDLILRRGVKDIRLFEVERVFLSTSSNDPSKTNEETPFPKEPVRAALVWSGAAVSPHWSQPPRQVDLFDIAGIVEQVLGRLRPGLTTHRVPTQREAIHPHRAMCWKLSSGTEVAWCGQYHPRLAADLSQPVYFAVIDIEALKLMSEAPAHYRALPKLGSAARDLAVVMPPGKSYAEVLRALHEVEPPVRVHIDAVDRYEGPPLEDGEASLTIRFSLQPDDRSLTEDQIESYRSDLVKVLKGQLGLKLRD